MKDWESLGMISERCRETPEGCWEWTPNLKPNGYGRLQVGGREGKEFYAHRFSYAAFNGPVPGGLQVDHLCRNRACCNPDHLEAVSCRENLMRGQTLTASRAAQTHCMHGHEFTTENIRRSKNGTRHCRTCDLRRARESRNAATS